MGLETAEAVQGRAQQAASQQRLQAWDTTYTGQVGGPQLPGSLSPSSRSSGRQRSWGLAQEGTHEEGTGEAAVSRPWGCLSSRRPPETGVRLEPVDMATQRGVCRGCREAAAAPAQPALGSQGHPQMRLQALKETLAAERARLLTSGRQGANGSQRQAGRGGLGFWGS